jgi:ribonuclease PH
LALRRLIAQGVVSPEALALPVAAVSVGVVNGVPCVDLCYVEDSQADVDLNVVANGEGEFIEVQGTAEGQPFNRATLDELLDLAANGIGQLVELQLAALDRG